MTLRWLLIIVVVSITSFIVAWDIAVYRLADLHETISSKVNKVSHEHPEVPFGMGAGLVFCAMIPLLPRRRRWLAVFMVFMLCMAVVAAHCVWPVYN